MRDARIPWRGVAMPCHPALPATDDLPSADDLPSVEDQRCAKAAVLRIARLIGRQMAREELARHRSARDGDEVEPV